MDLKTAYTKILYSFEADERYKLTNEFDTLEESIYRLIPMKPFYIDGQKTGLCNNCHFEVDVGNYPFSYPDAFCKHCGQKLDWDDILK